MNITAEHPIAYFCAEYGISHRLPIYAGGLGILAGDTLKAAADLKIPMIGLGLLYRGEDQVQTIDRNGFQHEDTWFYDPVEEGMEHVYLDEMPLFVKVHIGEIDVWARVWKKQIGESVTLYLLDTETDQNRLSERNITHALYSGSAEHQLKQQLVLGVGGCKLLRSLGIHPAVYHLNEGRPTFVHWALTRFYMEEHQLDFAAARERARSKTVYTNHTLVAAGNPGLPAGLVTAFGAYYADKMGVSVERLLELGYEANDTTAFHLTRSALNASVRANGVSALHSRLSAETWPEYTWVNITNGVHLPTWQDSRLRSADAASMSDEHLWQIHRENKRSTMEYVQRSTGFGYDPDRLVIGWARRIAGYKQLKLVFAEINRLVRMLRSDERPIRLLISGKAHFGDNAGKEELQKIIHHMARELSGYALFVPNYHIEIAQHLVRGCDVWLNTPEFGKEASGTSGMKAIANGVLQCTVADGWAAEVDWNNTGWVIHPENIARSWLDILEHEIVPEFYDRVPAGYNPHWVQKMRRSIALAEQFSAERMMREYQTLLYQDTDES